MVFYYQAMKNAILGTDLSAASDRIIENSAEFKLFGISRIILVYVLNLRSTEDLAEYNLSSAQDKMDDQKTHLLSLGLGFSDRDGQPGPGLHLRILPRERQFTGSPRGRFECSDHTLSEILMAGDGIYSQFK